MPEMSSRERVVTALEHREPDRVPFDCTFSYGAYLRLKEYLGHESREVVRPAGPFLNVRPPLEFMKLLNVDLFYIGLGRGEHTPIFECGADTFTDEWGVTFRKIENPSGVTTNLRVTHSATLPSAIWPIILGRTLTIRRG